MNGGEAASADYITTINGIVQYFRRMQDASGRIIDQYRGAETQYATPCFAFACATVWKEGLDATLLGNCTAALTAATREVSETAPPRSGTSLSSLRHSVL